MTEQSSVGRFRRPWNNADRTISISVVAEFQVGREALKSFLFYPEMKSMGNYSGLHYVV